MVAIPVRLYKAARRERVRFRNVYRPAPRPPIEEVEVEATEPEESKPEETSAVSERQALPAVPFVARVRNMPVGEVGEEPIERPQVLKGYEIEKDEYVALEPGEVAALRPKTSSEMGIVEFVHLKEIDPIYFETSYYAVPDAGGEKPYALLFRALADSGYAGLGSLAMHGREHATVIRPGRRGLIVHTLFYANEVRAGEEYASDPGPVSAKELELAKTLVRALAAPFDPGKLRDAFEEKLREFIRSRADTAVAAYEKGEAPKRAPVVDIMEALRKSLAMARKGPKSERVNEKPAASRRRAR